jgi:hypothetical protein
VLLRACFLGACAPQEFQPRTAAGAAPLHTQSDIVVRTAKFLEAIPSSIVVRGPPVDPSLCCVNPSFLQVELAPDAASVGLAPFHDTLPASTSSSSSSTNGSSSNESSGEGQQGAGSSSSDGLLSGDVTIGVARAVGNKCGRCWNYSTLVGSVAEYPDLCERCHPVIVKLGFKPPQQAAAAAPAKQTVGAA